MLFVKYCIVFSSYILMKQNRPLVFMKVIFLRHTIITLSLDNHGDDIYLTPTAEKCSIKNLFAE